MRLTKHKSLRISNHKLHHRPAYRMRFFVIAFAVIAAARAASFSSEYLPPIVDNGLPPSQEYLAPAELQSALTDDGYRYKVVRRLRLRHRREVSELPQGEYLPPVAEVAFAAPAFVQEQSVILNNDGYRYKTVRRLKYRHRRDVNELAAGEYLPPSVEAAPLETVVVEAPTVLADDGYRYKTVRRLKYRHRRDVNELPSSEYLPPGAGAAPLETVVVEAPTVLADDGYRYKTVRRLKYRHRREVPTGEYLPPTEGLLENAIIDVPFQQQTVLAADGYRYKTVRRLKYRRH